MSPIEKYPSHPDWDSETVAIFMVDLRDDSRWGFVKLVNIRLITAWKYGSTYSSFVILVTAEERVAVHASDGWALRGVEANSMLILYVGP